MKKPLSVAGAAASARSAQVEDRVGATAIIPFGAAYAFEAEAAAEGDGTLVLRVDLHLSDGIGPRWVLDQGRAEANGHGRRIDKERVDGSTGRSPESERPIVLVDGNPEQARRQIVIAHLDDELGQMLAATKR